MTEELEQLLKNLKLGRILEIYDEQLCAAEKEDVTYRKYYGALEKEFNEYANWDDYRNATFNRLCLEFLKDISALSTAQLAVKIDAAPFVSTETTSVADKPHVFHRQLQGIEGTRDRPATPERNVRVSFAAQPDSKVYTLPFLGQVQQLTCRSEAGRAACVVPEIKKGMAVWLDEVR